MVLCEEKRHVVAAAAQAGQGLQARHVVQWNQKFADTRASSHTAPARGQLQCQYHTGSMRAEHPDWRSCWTSSHTPQIYKRLLPYRIPVALTAVRCPDKPSGEITHALRSAHRHLRLDKLSPKAAAASECLQVRLCCLSIGRSYWECMCGDLCRFAKRHRQVAVQL